jgi:phage tail sheath protein FI
VSDAAVLAQIRGLVAAVTERAAFSGAAQASARAALERDIRAGLEPLKRRGAITGFVVRCDDETCEGSAAPVVEVIVRLPRRVQQVVLRFAAGGA